VAARSTPGDMNSMSSMSGMLSSLMASANSAQGSEHPLASGGRLPAVPEQGLFSSMMASKTSAQGSEHPLASGGRLPAVPEQGSPMDTRRAWESATPLSSGMASLFGTMRGGSDLAPEAEPLSSTSRHIAKEPWLGSGINPLASAMSSASALFGSKAGDPFTTERGSSGSPEQLLMPALRDRNGPTMFNSRGFADPTHSAPTYSAVGDPYATKSTFGSMPLIPVHNQNQHDQLKTFCCF